MAFGIGVFQFLHDCNIASLMRSAYCLDASFVFTIGRKYQRSAADTVNCTQQIPYYHYLTFDEFLKNMPVGYQLVCVENPENAKSLETFRHPRNAIYLLGSEGQGLPKYVLDRKYPVVKVNSKECLNVSTTGSIVMYDRQSKNIQMKLSRLKNGNY